MRNTLEPFDLAERQIAIDREATARFPRLLARKQARQLSSPHGFLRGSSPLFYEILAARPELGQGPEGEGHIVGDMHLENVGAFETDDDEVVFDLNDFDDACVGPLRLDVLRLATSVLLAGRSFQATALESIALARGLLSAHRDALFATAPEPALAQPIAALLERVRQRTRKELLDARVPERDGRRAFVRGERYFALNDVALDVVQSLLESYVGALGERAPARARDWKLMDAAYRVAGTGSLGRLRIALLVKDDRGLLRLFELKEALPSAAERLLGAGSVAPATRVVGSARALVARPMKKLAALPPTAFGELFGRKLCPAEDKLELAELRPGARLDAVVASVGALVGRAHARALTRAPASPWSDDELEALLDRALTLAGLFEATHLAYARRAPAAPET